MKKDRLLWESAVVKAVDKHTNNYNKLDDDITCILEDVDSVIIVGSSESMKNITSDDEYRKSIRNKTIDEFAKRIFTTPAPIGENNIEHLQNIVKEIVRKMKAE